MFQDQSDSDEPNERRLYTGRYKVLPKGLQKTDKHLKEQPKRNKVNINWLEIKGENNSMLMVRLSYVLIV